MSQMQIGFIGLGRMGKPMAANLLKAGYSVKTTYHRNRAPAEELAGLGAVVVDTIIEVAQGTHVIITVLPADDELWEVYTGEAGLLRHLPQGAICIDMTSATAQTIGQITTAAEKRGIKVLDAPVSGGVPAAVQGTLSIMAGGDPDTLELCRPILESMAGTIFYTGGVGSGKAFKMINQLLNAGNTYVASEAIFLARQLGLDLNVLCEVIGKSSGDSFVFRNAVQKFMVPENFEGGFKLSLMTKDIGLSMQQAQQLEIDLPVMSEVYRIYQEIVLQGNGENHYAVVSKWVQQHNQEGRQDH